MAVAMAGLGAMEEADLSSNPLADPYLQRRSRIVLTGLACLVRKSPTQARLRANSCRILRRESHLKVVQVYT